MSDVLLPWLDLSLHSQELLCHQCPVVVVVSPRLEVGVLDQSAYATCYLNAFV